MWTISDTGMLINLAAVRSIGVEVSDDRQFVEVQVRWANDGDRFAIATLIVQEFGDVRSATEAAWRYVEAVKEKFVASGSIFTLPNIAPPAVSE